MFETADTLFGHGEEEFPIANEAGRRIVHLRIVETESDHSGG